MKKAEHHIQKHIAQYLRAQYPDVLFRSDLGGVKLTIGQAVQVKAIQGDRGWPDIFIAEPRHGFCGLFFEIKAEEKDLLTRAGKLRKNKHIQEQVKIIETLKDKGYYACFVIGFQPAVQVLDWYLKNNEGALKAGRGS